MGFPRFNPPSHAGSRGAAAYQTVPWPSGGDRPPTYTQDDIGDATGSPIPAQQSQPAHLSPWAIAGGWRWIGSGPPETPIDPIDPRVKTGP
jgi:hypothetical protein